MELLTPLDTICRLILRARELEAQVPAQDPDEDPEDVDDLDDDGDQALSVLADDQLTELLALAWVGRGTYDQTEWDDAFAEAGELGADDRIDELLDMPLLASHLDAGLAAFDFSCDGVGQVD